MNYRDLFADVRRRPGSYGLDGSFREAVAFINGCDAGNDWGLLIGFPEWLAVQLKCKANLTWSALVLKLVQVAQADGHSGDQDDSSEESRTVDTLFTALDEFLAARGGGRGSSIIIAKYLESNR